MIKLVSPELMLIEESRVLPVIAKDAPLMAKNETGTGAMSVHEEAFPAQCWPHDEWTEASPPQKQSRLDGTAKDESRPRGRENIM